MSNQEVNQKQNPDTPLYTKQWTDEDICDEEDAEAGLLNGGFKGEALDLNPRDWLLPQPDEYYWELEESSSEIRRNIVAHFDLKVRTASLNPCPQCFPWLNKSEPLTTLNRIESISSVDNTANCT